MVLHVGERGIVHIFRPSWTEPDPANPGKRRLRESSTWNWRFEYRNRKYSGGDGYKTQREAREAGDRRMREVKAGLEEDPHKATFAVLERILKAEAELQKNEATKASTLAITARLFDVPSLRTRLSTRCVRTGRSIAIDQHSTGVTHIPPGAKDDGCAECCCPSTCLSHATWRQTNKSDCQNGGRREKEPFGGFLMRVDRTVSNDIFHALLLLLSGFQSHPTAEQKR